MIQSSIIEEEGEAKGGKGGEIGSLFSERGNSSNNLPSVITRMGLQQHLLSLAIIVVATTLASHEMHFVEATSGDINHFEFGNAIGEPQIDSFRRLWGWWL